MPPHKRPAKPLGLDQLSVEALQKRDMATRLILSLFREGVIGKAEARKMFGLPEVKE